MASWSRSVARVIGRAPRWCGRARPRGSGHCSRGAAGPRYPPCMPSDAATRTPATPGPTAAPTTRRAAARSGPSPRSRPDRRPRRPDARRGPGPGAATRARARTCPAGSRWSRAGRPPTPPAGSAGSGRDASLIAAVGRDAAGRALVDAIRADGVTAARLARRRAPGPAGSASSSSPAASAASWPTAAPPTCSPRATSEPPGSPAPTRSTCRSTRCSASRSGLAGRRAIELARGARRGGQRRPRVDRAAAGRRPARGARH